MGTPHELQSIADLDRAIDDAQGQPLLIFKHSLTCGTSGWAAEEVAEVAASYPRTYVVTVQRTRDVSREIERRFKVRHESPQVLLIVGDQVVWHASHYRLTAKAIEEAVGKVAALQPAEAADSRRDDEDTARPKAIDA